MFIDEPKTQIELGEVELLCFSSPPEGVGPSFRPSVLHPVHTLPSKSRPVFSS